MAVLIDANVVLRYLLQEVILSRSVLFVNGNALRPGSLMALSPEQVQAVRMKRFRQTA